MKKRGKGKEDLGKLFEAFNSILETHGEKGIKLLTGLAGLAGKIAYSDMEISESEVERLRAILKDEMGGDDAKALTVLELMTKHRVLLFSVEDHIYARLLNEVAESDEKRRILRLLFRIAAADGSIDSKEDSAIALIARSLNLSHKEFIAARLEFKEHLEVLKKSAKERGRIG